MSDKAFLLYGQPVVNAKLTIRSSVELIDKDSKNTCPTTLNGKQVQVPCFQLEACASYADPDLNFPYIGMCTWHLVAVVPISTFNISENTTSSQL